MAANNTSYNANNANVGIIAPTTSQAITAAAAPANKAMERTCENPDCNITKLISMVPKRKVSNFVQDPVIMDKPMLINGFTTVFQVEGTSAKLQDLKNPSVAGPPEKPTYRVIPNTHAHIVNYVVVEPDGESIRKIKNNDPATMRKLLESQRASAAQMLKKLMAGHVPSIAAEVAPAAAAIPTTIQLPTRMHPNLQITAVSGADANVPLITPVPLTNLQTPAAATTAATPVAIASTQATAAAAPSTLVAPMPAPAASANDSPANIEKMKAELEELRRTVTLLAEAQAKSQQAAANTSISTSKARKRPSNAR